MGFLSGAAGGQSGFQAKAATGDATFTDQKLQPFIQQTQGDYAKQLQMSNDIYGQQGSLAQQLQAQANGQGPNIAQLQLQQATNRNIAQGAGQIGSIRGINPALAARLIEQNTAAQSQQAAGQSGLMRAQQQLAAQQNLAGVYGQQAGEALGGGQLAGQLYGTAQGAQTAQNQQIVDAKSAADKVNAETALANAKASQSAGGGLLSGLASVAGTAFGGPLGGAIAGAGMKALSGGAGGQAHGGKIHGQALKPGDHPENDIVPAMLSPGEIVVPRSITQAEDAPEKAAEFIRALQKHKDSEKGPKGYSKVLDAKRKMKEAMEHMKKAHESMKDIK